MNKKVISFAVGLSMLFSAAPVIPVSAAPTATATANTTPETMPRNDNPKRSRTIRKNSN